MGLKARTYPVSICGADAPIMNHVLVAALLTGYVVCAAAFYMLSVKTAGDFEESQGTLPSKFVLTVVEGGRGHAPEIDRAA